MAFFGVDLGKLVDGIETGRKANLEEAKFDEELINNELRRQAIEQNMRIASLREQGLALGLEREFARQPYETDPVRIAAEQAAKDASRQQKTDIDRIAYEEKIQKDEANRLIAGSLARNSVDAEGKLRPMSDAWAGVLRDAQGAGNEKAVNEAAKNLRLSALTDVVTNSAGQPDRALNSLFKMGLSSVYVDPLEDGTYQVMRKDKDGNEIPGEQLSKADLARAVKDIVGKNVRQFDVAIQQEEFDTKLTQRFRETAQKSGFDIYTQERKSALKLEEEKVKSANDIAEILAREKAKSDAQAKLFKLLQENPDLMSAVQALRGRTAAPAVAKPGASVGDKTSQRLKNLGIGD